MSDDGDFVFTTDEQADSYIGAYDITDMNNIQEVDRIQSNPESNSIPHNTHVDGNFLVTSGYRDGTVVHDATFPNNLVEVANYDSYAGSGNGFDGCSGTFPYLSSGLIISSDINSASNGNGRLLLLERGFSQACYLQGNVTDLNNQTISGVDVVILNTVIPNLSNTDILGNYTTGNADSGIFDVVFSKFGYISDTLQATMVNGQITYLDAVLNVDNSLPILGCQDSNASNFNPIANTSSLYGGELNNTFSSGDYFNGEQHLIFNAYSEFNIKSAEFYAESPKLITFELRNSNGVVLDDTTHFVSVGNQTLQLNFEVPISNDLQLGLSSGNSGLFRNDQGASYPYNIGSVMSITGSSASQPGYYYFYYNIQIDVPCEYIFTNLDELVNNKKLLKIVDVLGRESIPRSNNTYFYIYEDGTVDKKIYFE